MAKADDTAADEAMVFPTSSQMLQPDGFSPSQALMDLLEAASDWLWETDADLRFCWLSDNYQSVTGIDPASVIGRFRFDFLEQVLKGNRSPPLTWRICRRA